MFGVEELELLLESVNVKISEVQWALNNNYESSSNGLRVKKNKELRQLRTKIKDNIKILKYEGI